MTGSSSQLDDEKVSFEREDSRYASTPANALDTTQSFSTPVGLKIKKDFDIESM